MMIDFSLAPLAVCYWFGRGAVISFKNSPGPLSKCYIAVSPKLPSGSVQPEFRMAIHVKVGIGLSLSLRAYLSLFSRGTQPDLSSVFRSPLFR